ncbi:right-handed parallel beta-helix repeat-containing protein [Ruficoccus amylovorans]|uniref:Right-handed parallel beta-helix repeat-containing protein n=2 Tax=Ruficoccus amylovorans TaxID=1804625 RepID=A0A842HCD5_9BACT|nr:right-handed parallel beta-helix repeat-containing protein [Ruficoccus amylovorans]
MLLRHLYSVEAYTHKVTANACDYTSLQEAIDSNPGQRIDIGVGDWTVDRRIRITHDGSGLVGYGRIIQSTPSEPVVEVKGAKNVLLRDITLTRTEGTDGEAEGLFADSCSFLRVDGITVLDNRSRSGAISLRECVSSTINNCTVLNYMRIAIDDRMDSPKYYGFAFHCIDGTGISARDCEGTLIAENTVIEENLCPTPEIKEQYQLGTFSEKAEVKGSLIAQEAWDKEYVAMWQQGSAIWVGNPVRSRFTRILGNRVQNAAQGIDLHTDQVIVANNLVDNAFIGMKAMHGSRNVLITGNQFSRNVLWSIGLMPGKASHGAKDEFGESIPPNSDGSSVIANNIISDFGYGDAYWVWENEGPTKCVFRLDIGQEPDDPPLTDVIVTGNVIQSNPFTSLETELQQTPRFKYAVLIETSSPERGESPRGLRISNNILQPGTDGISNQPLPE